MCLNLTANTGFHHNPNFEQSKVSKYLSKLCFIWSVYNFDSLFIAYALGVLSKKNPVYLKTLSKREGGRSTPFQKIKNK